MLTKLKENVNDLHWQCQSATQFRLKGPWCLGLSNLGSWSKQNSPQQLCGTFTRRVRSWYKERKKAEKEPTSRIEDEE